jgi:hypothetical protein
MMANNPPNTLAPAPPPTQARQSSLSSLVEIIPTPIVLITMAGALSKCRCPQLQRASRIVKCILALPIAGI